MQSLKMFDDKMYMQLLGIVDLAIKQAIINSENFETEYVSLLSHYLSFSFFFFSSSRFQNLAACVSLFH